MSNAERRWNRGCTADGLQSTVAGHLTGGKGGGGRGREEWIGSQVGMVTRLVLEL